MPLLTFSQKTNNKSVIKKTAKAKVVIATNTQKNKDLNSNKIDSSVIAIVKYVLGARSLMESSETEVTTKNDTANKRGNVYGYLELKKNTKVKLYYGDDKKLILDTNNIKEQVKALKSKKKNVRELPIDSEAEYSFVKIDSVQIKWKQNKVSRIIPFSTEGDGFPPTVFKDGLSFADINNDTTYLSIQLGNKKAFIKSSDILIFIPYNDEDNVISDICTLSTIPPSNKIILLTQ
jgi:hypothetical protein